MRETPPEPPHPPSSPHLLRRPYFVSLCEGSLMGRIGFRRFFFPLKIPQSVWCHVRLFLHSTCWWWWLGGLVVCHGSTKWIQKWADDDPAASSFDLCSLQKGKAVVRCEETSPSFLSSFLPPFRPSVNPCATDAAVCFFFPQQLMPSDS